MKIAIVASELFDGGEITWTRVLIEALKLLEGVHSIKIFINKDYDYFAKLYNGNEKINIIKVNWKFRFGISKNQWLINKIIRVFTLIRNPIGEKLFKFESLNKSDILIFPYVATEAEFANKPFILCPQDIRHKHNLEFNTNLNNSKTNFMQKIKHYIGEWAYTRKLKKAKAIVCESNYVKKDLVKFYGIENKKIFLIISPPILTYSYLLTENLSLIKEKYNLSEKYIFYPAHLIFSKNHIRLLQAIALIRDKYREKINLILVGSKKNNFENTMKEIERLNLRNQVKYLGYVPEEDMPYLYKLSTALVMPTLFESVSIPIWEAFYLGCPVVSSNVCALPEQVGDAGLLFNPKIAEDIAGKIYKIWKDKELREKLVSRGYERVKNLTLENYAKQWKNIIEEALGVSCK